MGVVNDPTAPAADPTASAPGPAASSGTAHDPTAPYAGFGGKVGTIFSTSEPCWAPPPRAPEGAPNVVIVLADDLGYADLGCYGSEIATPELDRLAAEGVRYTNFHVNPMCSPTRASLMTGLNAHMAGVGHIVHSDPGFPGYAHELRDNAVTMAEVFRDHGWATLMTGKWHLTKDAHLSDAAPKYSWPLQRGFDRFYGILDAFTNYHQPHRLCRDNHHVSVDRYPDGYYFTDDLTDQAIAMIDELRASHPAKPFFLYYAHGAPHAPLQAKPADMGAYRGRYAAGWDRIRAERFERQQAMGVVEPGTVLPPRNSEAGHEVGPWDDCTAQERELFARYMEIYAGMVDNIDQNFGRLRRHLEAMGEWDNTIVVFTSDNGGSREGHYTGPPPTSAACWPTCGAPTWSRWRSTTPASTCWAAPRPWPTTRWAGPWRLAPRSGSTRSTPTGAATASPSSSPGPPGSGVTGPGLAVAGPGPGQAWPGPCAASTSTSPTSCPPWPSWPG